MAAILPALVVAALALALVLAAMTSEGRPTGVGSRASPRAQGGPADVSATVASAPCDRWVAPGGDDANPGTRGAPWATLAHAAAKVRDRGCTVWFEDGVYTAHTEITRRFTERATFRAVHPYHATLTSDETVLELNGASTMTFRDFEFRHTGDGASGLLVYTSEANRDHARRLKFVDNIFHDSYDNDLMKLHDGTRSTVVRNNVFYNQGDGEEQMDINSVADVTVEGNIFFNDYASSGRAITDTTKHFITVKDSNGGSDGLLGSHHVSMRRNVFINWEGTTNDGFLNVGNDGKPYFEAVDVAIENNLLIGNPGTPMDAPLSIAGAKDVAFVNNTVTGDLPSDVYAFRVYTKDDNPRNENITFVNNIWSDPTGTMGAGLGQQTGDFSGGDPPETTGLVLDTNLYWNGGEAIPGGDLIDPTSDEHGVIANPQLEADQSHITLPFWNGSSFLSGTTSIAEEFDRLVSGYAAIPSVSAAVGRADPSFAPSDDILRRPRDERPDLGAFEA